VRAWALGFFAALVVALLVASEAGAGSPTRASWAAAANRYCSVASAQVIALPKPTTLPRLIADFRGTLVIAKRETRQLARIARPPRERSLIGKLLANSRKQDSISQKLLQALIEGDLSRARFLGTEIDPLNTRYDKIARKLGARICAEINPFPSG
jgi:hypothetical protein